MSAERGGAARYRIVRRLASGGMAELYLGRMSGIQGVEKTVAIKRIRKDLADDKAFVEMFLDEARVAATLQHPNIVQTYDVVSGPEGYFLSMEYLDGADVRVLVRAAQRKGQGVPVPMALQIVIGALAGLHYAHERRDPEGRPMEVVHRDVSPHNLFLTREGAVKLLDFGVAKATNNVVRTAGAEIKGKVRYLSPEQCVAAPVDRRADVYAAGVVLYELLTGERTHRGENPYATMRQILHEPVAPLRSVAPHLDEDLERIVMRSLEKKRSLRYGTAQAFQAALEAYCQQRGWFLSPIQLGSWVTTVLEGDAPAAESKASARPERRVRPSVAPLVSTDHVTLSRAGGLIVARVHGVLDERFDGDAIGQQLADDVVCDLSGVTRVTSFGIRAWLGMMAHVRQRGARMWFARCPEPFLNQVAMVRGMLGRGRIVSFDLPFRCVEDHGTFAARVEGAAGKAFLETQVVPPATCPGGEAHRVELDDDPLAYRFAEDFEPEPPRDVMEVLAHLEASAQPQDVEMELTGSETRVVLRRIVDASPRWRRVFDGVEGRVSLDLREVGRVEPGGAEALVKGLERIADDLDRLVLRAAPEPVWEACRASTYLRPRMVLRSLQVEASCPEPVCAGYGVRRMAVAEAPTGHRDPATLESCRRCGTELRPVRALPESLEGARATPLAAPRQPVDRQPAPVREPDATPPKAPVPAPAPVTASAPGCLARFLPFLAPGRS